MINCLAGELLNVTKYPTADDLFKEIKNQRVTYAQLEQVDSRRFSDLEEIMKMLFDHAIVQPEKSAKNHFNPE